MNISFRHRKIIIIILSLFMAVFSFGTERLCVKAENPSDDNVVRIAGNNRHETAVAISETVKEIKQTDTFDTVIIASGDSFPDALAGSYLSAVKEAPILLVNDAKAVSIIKYIQSNISDKGKVYILGGTSAVSLEVENKLKEIPDIRVRRLKGSNRYETNLSILRECGDLEKELLIATGTNYADSLSASSLGLPVMLVSPQGLNEKQKEILNGFEKITILGGVNAVSSDVEKELSQYGDVRRIRGANREETSCLIAGEYYPETKHAILAFSGNYPDGLCGGLLGYLHKAPILLVSDKRWQSAADYVKEKNIHYGTVLGGTGVLNDETVNRIFADSMARYDEYSRINEANLEKVRSYIDRVYSDNIRGDYTLGDFTWFATEKVNSWIYTTGFVFEGYLENDPEKYCDLIIDYYDQHVKEDGSILHYITGELDSVIPATGMIDLINSGRLDESQSQQYKKAVNYVYNNLEEQLIYPQAGNLWQHSERNGVPTMRWEHWNICLDGIYMSQLYLSRLAQSIEKGTIEITDLEGNAVRARDIWHQRYDRISFVMENMMSESGMLYHGYCVEEQKTNGVCWGRANGWFAMALLETALNCPDEYKDVLRNYFVKLMDGALKWQDEATFLWYNVIDHREEVTDNIPETSVSGMLSYCLMKGYRTGLLQDEKYYRAGLRAFNALAADRIVDGDLTDIMSSSGVTSDINRYAVNKYVSNEAKGIGALILAMKYVRE